MKPSKMNRLRFMPTQVLSVLSFAVLSSAVLFSTTGCYTKLATNEGDHWGYTGPVKQKVVVRETDDTIVVRETRVIHQPQPVVTDTVTYSNTTTGEENVVVNNYFAPPTATFGAYDPWTNTYPTWYDDYWYRPQAAVVISICDPYYHHSPWFRDHWRRYSYYQSYWDYDYYYPWNNWYHASYRGPGWAYYDPYYSYPPQYGFGYGCCVPIYDPFPYWPSYGYGGGYYDGGYCGGDHGYGHHGYYGNDNDDRDRNGRERKRGNVGGEERGRGGRTTDNGRGNNTGGIIPRNGGTQVDLLGGEGVNASPASTTGRPVDGSTETARNGSNDEVNDGAAENVNTGRRIGNFDISTGEMPTGLGARNASTSGGREIKSSPSQASPNVYSGTSSRAGSVNNTPAPAERQPTERQPAERGPTETANPPANRTAPAPANVVKTSDPSSPSTPASRNNSKATESTSAPRNSAPAQAPSYTPRTSNASPSSSGSRSNSSSSSSSSSTRGNDSRGSDSRGSDSRSDDSRSNNDGGGRGRR